LLFFFWYSTEMSTEMGECKLILHCADFQY
jgi:hypothetical protein